DADLGVVGDQGQPVAGGGGLDVAEDRLGGPGGDRGRDQLARRQQPVPLARHLHGEALLTVRGSWFTPAAGSRLPRYPQSLMCKHTVAVVRRPRFPARIPRSPAQPPCREAVRRDAGLWKTWRARGAPPSSHAAPIWGRVRSPNANPPRAGRRSGRATRAPGFPQGARRRTRWVRRYVSSRRNCSTRPFSAASAVASAAPLRSA